MHVVGAVGPEMLGLFGKSSIWKHEINKHWF